MDERLPADGLAFNDAEEKRKNAQAALNLGGAQKDLKRSPPDPTQPDTDVLPSEKNESSSLSTSSSEYGSFPHKRSHPFVTDVSADVALCHTTLSTECSTRKKNGTTRQGEVQGVANKSTMDVCVVHFPNDNSKANSVM
ncbi:uncharacterized [Tachysurus ichikawai]